MQSILRLLRGSFARFLLGAGLALALAGPAAVQAQAGDLKRQIVGAWTLAEVVLEQGGKRLEPFGPDPRGFMSYDADGNFVYVLLRGDLPKIASNNRTTPTPEESMTLIKGLLAAYGTYDFNSPDGSMTSRITAGSFPNWNGTEQKRIITINGDELRVINPTPPSGGGTAYLVWKRLKK